MDYLFLYIVYFLISLGIFKFGSKKSNIREPNYIIESTKKQYFQRLKGDYVQSFLLNSMLNVRDLK